MYYLTRLPRAQRDPDARGDEYQTTAEVSIATLDAMTRRECDECGGPISWASRTILMHGSTIDHEHMYLTVACPLCLPTVATRLSVR